MQIDITQKVINMLQRRKGVAALPAELAEEMANYSQTYVGFVDSISSMVEGFLDQVCADLMGELDDLEILDYLFQRYKKAGELSYDDYQDTLDELLGRGRLL